MAPSVTDDTDDTDDKDDQGAPASPGRERPSRLIDVAVAVLLLIADAIIVVVAVTLLVAVGMGRTRSSGAPVLTWFVIWGGPAVAAAGAVVHARLRMPVTAVVQGLFTLACTVLAVAWTRMLLS
ncbi:hypothetical protein ACFZDI_09880 [Streptomyces sp. NPDC007907]|uniref:hypothetical protein n=1 Tax=Streptomyces sp. NPDC007907 TaxID=3364789 RepID=UPI0036E2B76C